MSQTCATWTMQHFRVWDIRHDGVPVARMIVREAGVDQTYPESALLLLNTEQMTVAEACREMAGHSENSAAAVLTLGMLSESMYPLVGSGSQDAFDALYAYGEDAEEAERSFLATTLESPVMLTPLIQIVQ